MKKSLSTLGKVLTRKEQQQIAGSRLIAIVTTCIGTGTGGVGSVGHSSACVGREQDESCTINGHAAACTGIGGGFWFY
ncbi:hypothetical protein [uncultured Aquimarina sp.]|uniref:hypothetical protein n=1 Tax=uncultured Aquimarina sp. TaxID=575652 RepID=UPI00262408DA|nr:hypothetical protein [uncultured Aquimarina sp.]